MIRAHSQPSEMNIYGRLAVDGCSAETSRNVVHDLYDLRDSIRSQHVPVAVEHHDNWRNCVVIHEVHLRLETGISVYGSVVRRSQGATSWVHGLPRVRGGGRL